MTRGAPDERGFALLAVLLVLAMVGALGAEFAYSTRLEATAVRTWKDNVIGGHLAEAAVAAAVREIVANPGYVTLAEDGLVTFYTSDRVPIARRPRDHVPLGGGQYSYRITDEAARLNVNTTPPARLDRLLQSMGVDKVERDIIVDSLQDWRDGNEEHRANGAESEDYYLKLPVPYRARNGNLESVTELLQIRGVSPALFRGPAETATVDRVAGERTRAQGTERAAGERPGLADLVTVAGGGQVNINTASKTVLTALGFSEAEMLEIEATRRQAPYPNSGRFGGRGLVAVTQVFRIEAQGIVDGRVRARVTAIVQIAGSTTSPAVRVLDWSGVR